MMNKKNSKTFKTIATKVDLMAMKVFFSQAKIFNSKI